MKRREKSKKELLQLTIEVMEKRYQMEDWDSKYLSESMAQRHKLPSFIPLQNFNRGWETTPEGGYIRKKREYKKRKHKQAASTQNTNQAASIQLPHYTDPDLIQQDFTTDDDAVSPVCIFTLTSQLQYSISLTIYVWIQSSAVLVIAVLLTRGPPMLNKLVLIFVITCN